MKDILNGVKPDGLRTDIPVGISKSMHPLQNTNGLSGELWN